jgi:hypothetical protein
MLDFEEIKHSAADALADIACVISLLLILGIGSVARKIRSL